MSNALTPHDLIAAARHRLDGGRCWVSGKLAVDQDGATVEPESSVACAWCVVGALKRGTTDARLLTAALDAVTDAINTRWPRPGRRRTTAEWQDQPGRTWAEVDRVMGEAQAALA